MFWHWPTNVPTCLYDEGPTKRLCCWPDVKCLQWPNIFWHWPTNVPTCLYDEGPTKKLCGWPNVNCLQWPNVGPTKRPHWPNIEPTCWCDEGPMSKLPLAQCNITTMAQHKLHRWPNDGPITYCYLGGFFLSWWWSSIPSCMILELTVRSLSCLQGFSSK